MPIADVCNHCRRGLPMFTGTAFIKGVIYHVYNCTECGKEAMLKINPHGYDMDDPRAKRTMHLTHYYAARLDRELRG